MKIGYLNYKDEGTHDGTRAGRVKPVRLVMTKKGWMMEIGGIHTKDMPAPCHQLDAALLAGRLWIRAKKGGTALKRPKVNA